MNFAFDPHIILLIISFFIALYIILRLWDFRRRPLVKTLIIAMSAVGWWSLCVAVEHVSIQLSAKIFWVQMSYPGIVILPVAWLIMALQYTEKEKWLTRLNMILLSIIPLVSIILVWTNGLHHLVWHSFSLDTRLFPPDDVAVHGMWWWVLVIYSYLLLALGVFIFINYSRRLKGVYRHQIRVVLAGMMIPWIGNILYVSGLGVFQSLDPTPLAFSLTGITFYWGLASSRLLDIALPGYEEVFRDIAEGVIITDIQNRIVDINPAAQKILSVNKNDVVWHSFNSLLMGNIGSIKLTTDEGGLTMGIFLGEGPKQLHYEVRVSPIISNKQVSGHIILLIEDTRSLTLANTDSLTGLYNNRHFHKMLDQEIARCSRIGGRFCLLMLDLDFFKNFNDTFGHQAGDALLHHIGEGLLTSIRTMDSAFRYGGEEFAVLLPETDPDGALTVAERIRSSIRQISIPQNQPVTFSIGISSYPGDGTRKEIIIAHADAALYSAKRNGRDRVCLSKDIDTDLLN